jgi:hypothetical protein
MAAMVCTRAALCFSTADVVSSDAARACRLSKFWCAVLLTGGARVLFGFAAWHPNTGGLNWVCSTPIRELDAELGQATTASGRRYRLGRHIQPEDVPGEGEEAWISFDLLIGADAADGDAVPPISADPWRGTQWVTACKMARHLGLTAPGREPADVETFLVRNMDAYMRRRAAGRPV